MPTSESFLGAGRTPLPAANSPAMEFARGFEDLADRVDAALRRPDLAAYRGWLKFLRFEALTAARRGGAGVDAAVAGGHRLDEWERRIVADPGVLATLRGALEWAYESPVDGSGQPFKMAIPADYDGVRPMALSIYMHGSGGNHMEHATEMTAQTGTIELSVLGRARTGGFRDLSEADVLHASDYVAAHWKVDPDRIRLKGGSMGGGGTYRLGARFPHRWASGRPTCGYATHLPMGNLITFPVYATHSDDDWVVSVLHQREPMGRLRALGGQAIVDETTGLGHAAWDYKAGNERGAAWVNSKVRPDSRTVRYLNYTAMDGNAVRGWWGEIVEWGGQPRPARFVLTAAANWLYAELDNIAQLKLRLTESPFDRASALHVSVNGHPPVTLAVPLPANAVLAQGPTGWQFAPEAEPLPFRLHTPGSASLLYAGEALMMVYGTQGTDAERAAMRAAAEAASCSPNPAWPDDSGELGPDRFPCSHNLYGNLPVKADREVTAEDLARCHLVLIGTAAQNTVVARMVGVLPVQFDPGVVTCSDGAVFRGSRLALGLVHYNPLAPTKLIFWVAADTAATYAAGSLIPQLMSGGLSLSPVPFGADLLIMADATWTIVAARSFDSRWHWLPGRQSSPLLDASFSTTSGLSDGIARAIRRAGGADVAMVGTYGSPAVSPVLVGVTRATDIAALFANIYLAGFELTGSELVVLARRLRDAKSDLLLSGLEESKIDSTRLYRVALPADLLWQLSITLEIIPANYARTDIEVRDAVEHLLIPPTS